MLGRHFGLRGMGEITCLRFKLAGWGVFGSKCGPLNGLKFCAIHIPHNKSNRLSLTNTKTQPSQHQCVKVCGDPSDLVLCPTRFFDFCFAKCHPNSTRFFGKVATENQKQEFKKLGLGDMWFKQAHDGSTNSVVSDNNTRTFRKEAAELEECDSWEKCTNHGNRAHALAKMIEADAPLEDRMMFVRHATANSQQPCARVTATQETNKHLVTKGVRGFQMG